MSTQSNFLFDRLNDFVDKGKAADVIHPDFGRVFATILQQIPINKPGKCDLRKATIRFIQKLLNKKKKNQIIPCQAGRMFQKGYCPESGITQYFHY